MALTVQQRLDLWAESMVDNFLTQDSFTITKQDLKAAVDALDDALDSASPTLNTAIPEPARTELTTRQKTILVGLIAFKRAKVI